MPKKRTFYSEEERKAHHEKKQREADLQIQELTKHWENDPKDIAEYLAFSTQFYKYSSRNTMLIYRQRPDSVFIASYTHWKELGYYVQEGEHGANIYRPETTRYFKPNVPNPTWVLLSKASPEQRHEVEIGMLESRDFTYFKPCTVFDISQTNCPPEDYPKLCGVGYNSTQHKDIYNTLCLYSEEIGVPVSEEDFEGISTRGTYNPRNKHIHINQLLGDTQKLDTLLHEMSHHLMGHSPNIEKPTMQREFEADGLSIMFGKTFGIEPSDARKSHLAACYQELLKAQPEVKIDALLAPVREKFQQHIETMEQELSLAGVIPQQIISSQKAAELKREQAMKKEPTVTVIWTESKRLHDGQTMRLSRANELFKAIVDLLHLNPQNGRSEAIEAALKFYFAYLSNQMNTDYLCGIYGRQVEALVQRATDRISSQLFKQAVETNMLTRIVAFEYELSKDEYDKMRSKAVAAVKRSTGRISLFDTMQDSEE